MRNHFIIAALFAFPLQGQAEVNDFQVGVVKTRENAYELTETKSALAYAYGTAWMSHRKKGDTEVAAFLLADGTSELFSISSNANLYLTNVTNDEIVGYWPLTRWSYQYHSPDIEGQFAEMSTEYPLPFAYETMGKGPGCLGDSPLRYGDIEGDGADEVVVILDGLFVIFSPDYQRTVFAEYLDESDWYNDQEMETLFSNENITVTQYVSRLWAENSDMRGPGVRAYGKLYFGDFDEDGNSDILAWRKSYRSNAGDDPVKGFTKLRDSWGHYERDLKAQAETTQGVTGEYLPQDTDPALIQEWLTNNQLTWSKGWPSTSECEGQEGKLIFEMHDPLLNDPDVLK